MRNITEDKNSLRCCIVNKSWQLAERNFNGIVDDCCDLKIVLANSKFRIIDGYIPVGTIFGYTLSVCATIDVTPMQPDFRDNQHVQIIIDTPVPIILVDIVGDFAGFTISQFIQVLVDIVNAYPGGQFTATNDDPAPTMTICFNGTSLYNLVGVTVSIVQPGYWYLKYTSKIQRDIPPATTYRTLGYSAISPRRPVYVADANGTPIEKLYVPNGDFIRNLFPSRPAGASSEIDIDLTGVQAGDVITTTVDPGLTTNFFNNLGTSAFTLTLSITDIGGIICIVPGGNYINVYILYCRVTDYNPGTGVLEFVVDIVDWNGGTNGLTGGTAMPPATIALTCPQAGGLGTTGGTATYVAGLTNWIFISTGTSWGTVSIYDCDLITGALTYNTTVEIPVGQAADACYFPNTEKVCIVGTGNVVSRDYNYPDCPIATIDVNTDTLSNQSVADFSMQYVRINLFTNIAYSSVNNFRLRKIDGNAANSFTAGADALTTNAGGGITFRADGFYYTATSSGIPCTISVVSAAPIASVLIADPPLTPLFTAPDFTLNAPPIITFNFIFAGGATNQTIPTISGGLDGLGLGGINLIWVNPYQFSVYTDAGGSRYTITGVVNNYINDPSQGAPVGELNFDVLAITQTTPAVPPGTPLSTTTPVVGNLAIGIQNWQWNFYPFIKGAQSIFFHELTGRLFVNRFTSVGSLLQSYLVVDPLNPAPTPAQIIASKIDHFSLGYPTVILQGEINYLAEADRMMVVFSSGQSGYIFNPNTLAWEDTVTHPAAGGTSETGGFIAFSYTGDATINPGISQYNFFSSTPNGSELGVVSFLFEQLSQIFGVFVGSSVPDVQTAEDNCQTEQQILDAIEQLKEVCGCEDCGDGINDILNPNPPVIVGIIYYGRSGLTALNEAQILALGSVNQTTFQGTFIYPAAPSTYIYFACPTSFGIPSSFDDLASPFDIIMDGSYPVTILINSISYRVWRSAFQLGGIITMSPLP